MRIWAKRRCRLTLLGLALGGLGLLCGCNGGSAVSDASALALGSRGAQDLETATASRVVAPYLDAASPGAKSYRVGPQDVLDITVFMVPDLTKSVQVSERGLINLPLIGDVRAAGATAAEIEREMQRRLGARYLKNPQVTVFVKEFNSQRITVEGSVKKPGVYPLRGQDSLMRSIAMAEGLDRDTASSNVVVFRMIDGTRQALRYDLDSIRGGRSEDPPIEAGDVIVVDDSVAKTAFSIFVKTLPLASAAALRIP